MHRNFYALRPGRMAVMVCALSLASLGVLPAAADTVRSTAKAKAKPVWVQAAAKHGGSGVNLRYAVPESLQPNQAGSLQLQFGGITDDDARVELRTPAGVTLTDASGAALTGAALPRGQITTLSLNVTAATDGMQFVDVFTTQGGRSSAQSVPLKVGKGELVMKKSGDLRIEPNGERVISMPAQ